MTYSPDGWLETVDGMPSVVFERYLDHPVARVWAALTEPARVADWIGQQTLVPEVGGAWRIDFALGGTVTGEVVTIDPPHRLELIWREPWIPGDARLLWSLLQEGSGTRLRLEHRFPAGYDPQEYAPGWHDFLVAFDEALEGRPTIWNEARRTISEAVFAAYSD